MVADLDTMAKWRQIETIASLKEGLPGCVDVDESDLATVCPTPRLRHASPRGRMRVSYASLRF